MNFRHRCCCFAFAVAASSSAFAAELSWEAPASCPDRDALRWRIEEALGTSLANGAPLSFSARVEEKSAKRWVVALDVTSDSNQADVQHRELEAANCDDLAQAVSVVIALALGADPTVPKQSSPETPAPSEPDEQSKPEPVASSSPQLARAAAPPKKAESPKSYWLAAELGPTFDIGSLPGLAPGIQVSGLAGKRALGVKLAGVAVPNSEKSGTPGGTFTLLTASIAVCGVSPLAITILRLCAGSEFGKLSGTGKNATISKTNSSGWVAPFVELGGSWPLFDESLRFFGAGTVAMPLIRKEFSVDNFGPIHQPDALIGRLGAGLELLWR